MAGSGIIKLMQEIAKDKNRQGLELATITKADPLTIKIDNSPLSIKGNFLINTVETLIVGDRVVISPIGSGYVIIGRVIV